MNGVFLRIAAVRSTAAGVLLCAVLLLPRAAAAQGQAPPPPDMKRIRKLRLQFDQEPNVKQVQNAALRYFRVNPSRVASYRRGASWKALMPEVDVTFDWDRNNLKRDMTDALYAKVFPVKESEDTRNQTYKLGVRAHWSLDRLVFNAEVLDVTSLVGVQEGLLREVTALYFTRRRLLSILALNPPRDPGEKITESIRLDEISANLDALTGGYFSRERERRGID